MSGSDINNTWKPRPLHRAEADSSLQARAARKPILGTFAAVRIRVRSFLVSDSLDPIEPRCVRVHLTPS